MNVPFTLLIFINVELDVSMTPVAPVVNWITPSPTANASLLAFNVIPLDELLLWLTKKPGNDIVCCNLSSVLNNPFLLSITQIRSLLLKPATYGLWASAIGSKLYPPPGFIPLNDPIVPIWKLANVRALYNIVVRSADPDFGNP